MDEDHLLVGCPTHLDGHNASRFGTGGVIMSLDPMERTAN